MAAAAEGATTSTPTTDPASDSTEAEQNADPARAGHTPLRPRYAVPLAVLAGGLLYLAFPPIGFWPLAPVGVALLVFTVAGHRARTAGGIGLAFGLAFFGLLVRWLVGNIGLLAWSALTIAEAVLMALMVAPLPALLRLPTLRMRAWTIAPIVAVWWTATEAFRIRYPLGGFPWGRLAFSQADSPVLGWARIAGAPGVTFVVALVAGGLAALALAARRGAGSAGPASTEHPSTGPASTPRTRPLVIAAGWTLLAAVLAVIVPIPSPKGGDDGEAVIALVQGNVPKGRTLEETARVRHITANHAELTKKLARQVKAGKVPAPDLVVWPENSTDDDPRTNLELRALVQEAVDAINRPILVGAILREGKDTSYNAGLMWRPGDGPNSGPGEWYAKRQLVPMGEYIPARSVLGGFGQLQLIGRDFTPGPRSTIFKTGKLRTADVVCYEIGYDGLVRDGVERGANLLVEQTNDATFIRDNSTDEPEQQLAMARLRAVEHDRSMSVVSTTGESAVVRPDGTVARRTGIWQKALVVETVPLRTTTTPATTVGPWPEYAISAVAVALLLATALRARARRRN